LLRAGSAEMTLLRPKRQGYAAAGRGHKKDRESDKQDIRKWTSGEQGIRKTEDGG